jgi:selenocysteine lyase/cysteine desulfurase
MATTIDVQDLRRRMPVTDDLIYLNHAAIGPMPAAAVERMASLGRTVAVTGDRRWPERNDGAEAVREQAAWLLGARHAHEVAFTGNTSEALSALAWGLDWRPGDSIVGAAPEFPSNVYPWLSLAPRGVEYRPVAERDGRVPAEDLLAAADERTRMIAVSWVQYASGYRVDLARLAAGCRERDLLLVVDAIQGVGALALDAAGLADLGLDAVALASHKWLLGPEGVGLLYVSDRVVERFRSTRQGWRSVAGKFEWGEIDPTPAEGALRFEAGTLNVYGIHALGASLELLRAAGNGSKEAVEARVLALADRAAAGLERLGFTLAVDRGPAAEGAPAGTSGIVAGAHPERTAEELSDALAERGIVTSFRAGRLRLSPHVYNTEDEIDRTLEALSSLV